MAIGKDIFRRNGYEVGWFSALAKVDNDEFYGFTGIDYEERLERAFAWGMDRAGVPRGVTRGKYSVEGSSIKAYKASALALIEALARKSPDGKSYGSVSFHFTLQYEEEDISITEELFGCRISGRKASLSNGADPLVDEIPITVMYAKLSTPNIQGMTLFDNRQGRY
ncbi:hypothetical protein WMF31_00670 [Sorangium sp. So ce1036]|uniref:hypothetical protein n=1 Tax=Sorangium sp. So ce1036 TaxID=3133328 RepID=UPI003F11A5A5